MTGTDARALRRAFGSFLTGVTIVTTVDADGNRFGFTANSFSSVSLDPPLLLVCPGRYLSSFDAFNRCTNFGVSVLAEGQEEISNTFASFKGDRFAATPWRPDAKGVPLISGAAAQFSAQTRQVLPAGDHIVLLGEVQSFYCSGARGLGYAKGQYFSLGLERDAAAAHPGSNSVVGAIIEQDGQILLQDTDHGLRPPHVKLRASGAARQSLSDHLAGAGLQVTLGKAYSIFDDNRNCARFSYFQARATDGRTGQLGRYVPISALPDQRFVSEAHADMLARYALEHENGNFGLYIGDDQSGDIHPYGHPYEERT